MNTSENEPLFDYSYIGHVDLADLSLLLTVSQMAQKQGRDVWVRDLPPKTWETLHALGLQDQVRFFPLMVGQPQ